MSLTDDRLIAVLREPDGAPADPPLAFSVDLYERLAKQAGYRATRRTGALTWLSPRWLIVLGLVALAAVIAVLGVGQRLAQPAPSNLAEQSRALYATPPAFRMQVGGFVVASDGAGSWRVEGGGERGEGMPSEVPAASYTVWRAGVGGGVWDDRSRTWQPLTGDIAPVPLSSELFWGTATSPASGSTARTPGSLACATWESLGDDEVAGRPAIRLRCVDRGLDMWLDRATLLVLRIQAGDHTPDWTPNAGMTVSSIDLTAKIDPAQFALGAPANTLPEGTPTRLRVGDQLPAWSGTTLDGLQVGSGDTIGRPAILAIWASWCQPCVDQLPELSGLAGRDDLQVVTIAFDTDTEAARAALPSDGHAYPVVADADGSIGGQFGTTAVPVLVFIDDGGIVRGFETGLIAAPTLEQAADDLVAGRPLRLPAQVP